MTLTEDQRGDFIALCQAIGYVVIHWSLTEQQVDNWVNVTFHSCGGKALRKNEGIPRSLRQKTEFLKDCFKKLPPLAPFAAEAIPLIQRISSLSRQRHDLIHGGITSLELIDGSFQFRKIGYEADTHTVSGFTFNLANFSKLEKSLSDLLTDTIHLSEKLANEFLVK